jgi:septum formation protein
MTDLVLASASPFRKSMLAAARISFRSEKAEIDERAVEAALGPADPEALVIGCDQTLALGAARFHKPRDLDEARRNLLRLRGRTHQLHSAVVLSRNGETLWRHVGTVDMTMRDFDAAYAGRYLASIGDRALASVGSYQIEAEGIHLFEKIEGDYFSIVGMPLLPLLAELRRRGVIDG